MLALPTSSHSTEDHKENTTSIKHYVADDIGLRFQERKSQFNKICSDLRNRKIKRYWSRYRSMADQKLQWCLIPKVGSTYMNALIQKTFPGKNSFSDYNEANSTKKFIFVREPYSRLVSGYLGKIATHPLWWKGLGAYITENFKGSNQNNDDNQICGHNVTFPEFIKYFIHSETHLQYQDPHFMPMFRQCGGCQKSFDYIGHLETMRDDVKYIFNSINASSDMIFDSDVQTIRAKCGQFLDYFSDAKSYRCLSKCEAMGKVWWSFQIRGLISRDVEFPLSGISCKNVTGEDFVKLTMKAHEESRGKFDKHKQKSEFIREMFRQVSLEDRLKVKELLDLDFQLFGYDAQPADIFPELVNT